MAEGASIGSWRTNPALFKTRFQYLYDRVPVENTSAQNIQGASATAQLAMARLQALSDTASRLSSSIDNSRSYSRCVPAPSQHLAAKDFTKPFCDFITDNPTAFHVVNYSKTKLHAAAYQEVRVKNPNSR